MNALTDLIIHFLTAHGGIVTYVLVAIILFSESGLLIGFFLPGDSLLIALGLLAPSAHFSLPWLVFSAALGAILGDSVGYAIGKSLGHTLLQRPDTWYFKKKYIEEAHAYFQRYGSSTLIIARFTPIIRTFVPTVAGMSEMDYRSFLTYNVIGGVLWAVTIILGGAYLAVHVPVVGQHVTLIEIAVLVVSVGVGLNHLRTLFKK